MFHVVGQVGGGVADSDRLGSLSQKVQDPGAWGGGKAKQSHLDL